MRLRDRGLNPRNTDPCVFLRKDNIVLYYIDDWILITENNTNATDDLFTDSLMICPEIFKHEDEGLLCRYLGVIVDIKNDGSIHIYQPNLIKRLSGNIYIEEHEKL